MLSRELCCRINILLKQSQLRLILTLDRVSSDSLSVGLSLTNSLRHIGFKLDKTSKVNFLSLEVFLAILPRLLKRILLQLINSVSNTCILIRYILLLLTSNRKVVLIISILTSTSLNTLSLRLSNSLSTSILFFGPLSTSGIHFLGKLCNFLIMLSNQSRKFTCNYIRTMEFLKIGTL